MIISTSDNKPKKTTAKRVSTRKSVSPVSKKEVTVKKTVKNESANVINKVHEDIKAANEYREQMDSRVTRIKEDIDIIDKRIKSITPNGKETKRLNKEIKNAQDELKKLENVNPNAGVVNTFKNTEEYKSYKAMNRELDALKKDMQGNFRNEYLEKDYENSDAKSEYGRKVQSYVEEINQINKSGFYGRGIYKKQDNLKKKITNISDSIREKMTPEVKKLLKLRDKNPEVIEGQILDVNNRIKSVNSQIKEHTRTIKELDSEMKKLDDHRVDVMTKTEQLEEERVKIQLKKNEWIEKQLNFISKETEIKVDESFLETAMNPDGIMIKQKKRTTVVSGNNSKISDENAKIRHELFNWLDESCPKQWKIHRAYMCSHRLYYDKKSDRIKYDDKNGNYWGTFENQELEISYNVEKPARGNPVVYKLSSYGLITMADEGRNAFTAHGGANTTHDMIVLHDVPSSYRDSKTGEIIERDFTIVHGNVIVMPVEENNGLFCIGIKDFVKKTIRNHLRNLNAQYGVIRKKIEKYNEELKRIDDELKGIVKTDYDKYNRLENGKITKLKRKIAYQRGVITKLQSELSGLRKERKNLAISAGIVDMESEKQQIEENLSLYTDTRDRIKTLKKKIDEEKSASLKKYKEERRKELVQKATDRYNKMINGEYYNNLKKKYEDSVKEFNTKILENGRNLKNKQTKLENYILECSNELLSFDNETETLKARKKLLQQELKDIKKNYIKMATNIANQQKDLEKAIKKTNNAKKKAIKEASEEAVKITEVAVTKEVKEKKSSMIEKVKSGFNVLKEYANNTFENVKEFNKNVFNEINSFIGEFNKKRKQETKKVTESLKGLFGWLKRRK